MITTSAVSAMMWILDFMDVHWVCLSFLFFDPHESKLVQFLEPPTRTGGGEDASFQGEQFHGGCRKAFETQRFVSPARGFLSDLGPIDGWHGFPAIISG
jgi:hypothetical protein